MGTSKIILYIVYTDEYKLPFYVLKPKDSVVATYNFLNRAGFINQGKYRVRFHVLERPANARKPHGITYTVSRWFYFEMTESVVRKRHTES